MCVWSIIVFDASKRSFSMARINLTLGLDWRYLTIQLFRDICLTDFLQIVDLTKQLGCGTEENIEAIVIRNRDEPQFLAASKKCHSEPGAVGPNRPL